MSSTYKDPEPGTVRRLIAAVGGGLVVAGTVLPWTRYEMAGEALGGTTAGIAGTYGIAALLAGLVVAVVALFVNDDVLTAAVVGIAAVVALATAVPVLVDPTTFAPEVDLGSTSSYESAYGLWLTILGGLVACYEAVGLGWATRGDEDPGPERPPS